MRLRSKKRLRAAPERPVPVADVVTWRAIALEQQLPSPRFPAGVNAPAPVIFWALTLVALLCVGLFAAHAGDPTPRAVVDSQRDLVERLARTVSTSVDAQADQLSSTVRTTKYDTDPALDKLLTTVTTGDRAFSGAAVVNPATRAVLRSQGTAVPVPEKIETGRRTVTGHLVKGQPQILVTLPIDGDRVLVASTLLRVRSVRLNPDARHGVLVGAAHEAPVVVQGVAPATPQGVIWAGEGVKAAATGRTYGTSHTLPGTSSRALVVAAAPLGRTGLVVTSTVEAPLLAAGRPWDGVPGGLSLIAVAALGWWITYRFLIRPVRRLRAQAKAEATGDTAPRARNRGPREVARISMALGAPHSRSAKSLRRTLPAGVGLVAVFLITMSWSGGMILWYGDEYVATPTQIVRDEESRVEVAAHTLATSMDRGLDRVSRVVADHPSLKADDVRPALRSMVSRDNRFRGAYLVDAHGKVLASAGRRSLRTPDPLPGEVGIALQHGTGRLPVVFAYKAGQHGTAVMAEFDVGYLTGILSQIDGRVRVVDSQMRTIFDTDGHLAFAELTGADERAAAARALAGATNSDTVTEGWPKAASRRLVTAAGMVEPTTVTQLEWAVLADRSVSELSLPAAMRFRAAVLVAGVAAALALFGLGWQWLVVLRPLRALAVEADQVSAGTLEDPVSLRRHDEIGAIGACLEICRQVDMYGAARFGGALRLRRGEDDFTAVFPVIPGPRDRRSSLTGRR
ncbi:hypothetical protein Lfu02_59230 [Longispora fulva]|uniref:HAMP domain-containing protein n=1 Tax=Longispora fulva TaxID=619741 RepID=A0A8J7GG74_9ACTN|nr:HAMP domain-containing protein [Longispora fulva]MBG6137095.1 HAMP domain-containing protein [Longispora fulva]GIG61551.1 hypothetical protein Lfu02_59230 [Longispora fulva]